MSHSTHTRVAACPDPPPRCSRDDDPSEHDRDRQRGQAIVETALAFPILMLILLGVIGTGLYFLAGVQQASASTTIASWIGANPTADPDALAAYAATVSTCPVAVVYAPNLVTVTLSCPTIAGEILPMLPKTVTTVAKAYLPSPAPSPSPSPSASVAP